VHMSAFKQATGEAVYCDDMPKFKEELYLALVFSTRAHAKILRIDSTKALSMEGVVSFFSSKDIAEEHRRWVGAVVHDEEVFVSEKVHSQIKIKYLLKSLILSFRCNMRILKIYFSTSSGYQSRSNNWCHCCH